jgi:hypothetical protein
MLTSRSDSEPGNAATASLGECRATSASPRSARIATTPLRIASPSSSLLGQAKARTSRETTRPPRGPHRAARRAAAGVANPAGVKASPMRPQVKLMLVIDRVRSGRLEIRRDDLFDGPNAGRSLTTIARRRVRRRSRRLGSHRRSGHRLFLPPGKNSAALTRPGPRPADQASGFSSRA